MQTVSNPVSTANSPMRLTGHSLQVNENEVEILYISLELYAANASKYKACPLSLRLSLGIEDFIDKVDTLKSTLISII